MDQLRYDGKPDKRYGKKNMQEVIEATRPLPVKNGYVQYVFREPKLNINLVPENNVPVTMDRNLKI